MITSLWEANIERKDSLKPMPETHLSQETYDRLTAELHELTTVGRTRIAQAAWRAASASSKRC
jgi:hypothetical protein